jgi:hypothetical protein
VSSWVSRLLLTLIVVLSARLTWLWVGGNPVTALLWIFSAVLAAGLAALAAWALLSETGSFTPGASITAPATASTRAVTIPPHLAIGEALSAEVTARFDAVIPAAVAEREASAADRRKAQHEARLAARRAKYAARKGAAK